MNPAPFTFVGGPYDGELLAVDGMPFAYMPPRMMWVNSGILTLGGQRIPVKTLAPIYSVYELDGEEYVCIVQGTPQDCTETIAKIQEAQGDG